MKKLPGYPNAPNVYSIQVIATEYTEGDGTSANPSRRVIEYHGMDGEFLARRDQWLETLGAWETS